MSVMDFSVRRYSGVTPSYSVLPAKAAVAKEQEPQTVSPSDTFEASELTTGVKPATTQPKPDRYFQYQEMPLTDLRGAVDWSPGSKLTSGVEANMKVTSDYHALGGQMRAYMSGDPSGPKLPEIADFANLAKFGSRLGGEIIRDLENVMKADPLSLTDVVRDAANRTTMSQGVRMAKGALVRNLKNIPTQGLVGAATGAVSEALRTKNKLRDVMVLGNTTIHDSASRAYDAFLKGESSGQGGLEGLKKAGYYPGSQEDPMGMYTEAFARYKDARELGVQAQRETDSSRREALLSRRDELVKSANIRLFIHEQMLLENPTMYGDTDVRNAVGSISGTMVLKDPHGEYRLLPEGGNWTDFKTRMGFAEVPEGTPDGIRVPTPDGKVTTYKVLPEAVGTVSHYSNSRSAGPKAQIIPGTNPPELLSSPATASGQGVDNLGMEWVQGSLAGIMAEASVMPTRLGADALSFGGEWLTKRGAEMEATAPAQRMNLLMSDGSALDHVGLSLMTAWGGIEHEVGQNLKAVGRHVQNLSKYADTTMKAAYAAVGPCWIGCPLF